MVANTGRRPRFRSAALAMLVLLGTAGAALPQTVPPEGRTAEVPGSPPVESTDRLTVGEAGREFLRDAGRIWSSPARLRTKDVLPLAGIVAATGLLIASDESTRDGVQAYAADHAWVGDAAPVITRAGGLAGFAAAGAFFGAGLVFKDARARDTGYLAANAILQAFLVDNVLKSLSGRQRPLFADGEDHWAGPRAFFKRLAPGGSDAYGSFPSGHTAAAFSLATVVAMQYRRSGWVPVVAYTVAGCVGLSRIVLDKHWASDVAIGAVVGHFVARLVVRGHERRSRLTPMVACTDRGLALGFSCDLDPLVR